MKEIKGIKGNYYNLCTNDEGSIIVFVKSTKVLICDNKDFSLLREIDF